MALAVEWRSAESSANDERYLEVNVIPTSTEATIEALKTAGVLAARLHGRVTLLIPQVVPYPLPLESPPVLVEFNERRFQSMAVESHVDTVVRVYLCRDKINTLSAVMKPESMVVIGTRKSLWPTSEKRLAKKLRRAGHQVVLAETE